MKSISNSNWVLLHRINIAPPGHYTVAANCNGKKQVEESRNCVRIKMIQFG